MFLTTRLLRKRRASPLHQVSKAVQSLRSKWISDNRYHLLLFLEKERHMKMLQEKIQEKEEERSKEDKIEENPKKKESEEVVSSVSSKHHQEDEEEVENYSLKLISEFVTSSPSSTSHAIAFTSAEKDLHYLLCRVQKFNNPAKHTRTNPTYVVSIFYAATYFFFPVQHSIVTDCVNWILWSVPRLAMAFDYSLLNTSSASLLSFNGNEGTNEEQQHSAAEGITNDEGEHNIKHRKQKWGKLPPGGAIHSSEFTIPKDYTLAKFGDDLADIVLAIKYSRFSDRQSVFGPLMAPLLLVSRNYELTLQAAARALYALIRSPFESHELFGQLAHCFMKNINNKDEEIFASLPMPTEWQQKSEKRKTSMAQQKGGRGLVEEKRIEFSGESDFLPDPEDQKTSSKYSGNESEQKLLFISKAFLVFTRFPRSMMTTTDVFEKFMMKILRVELGLSMMTSEIGAAATEKTEHKQKVEQVEDVERGGENKSSDNDEHRNNNINPQKTKKNDLVPILSFPPVDGASDLCQMLHSMTQYLHDHTPHQHQWKQGEEEKYPPHLLKQKEQFLTLRSHFSQFVCQNVVNAAPTADAPRSTKLLNVVIQKCLPCMNLSSTFAESSTSSLLPPGMSLAYFRDKVVAAIADRIQFFVKELTLVQVVKTIGILSRFHYYEHRLLGEIGMCVLSKNSAAIAKIDIPVAYSMLLAFQRYHHSSFLGQGEKKGGEERLPPSVEKKKLLAATTLDKSSSLSSASEELPLALFCHLGDHLFQHLRVLVMSQVYQLATPLLRLLLVESNPRGVVKNDNDAQPSPSFLSTSNHLVLENDDDKNQQTTIAISPRWKQQLHHRLLDAIHFGEITDVFSCLSWMFFLSGCYLPLEFQSQHLQQSSISTKHRLIDLRQLIYIYATKQQQTVKKENAEKEKGDEEEQESQKTKNTVVVDGLNIVRSMESILSFISAPTDRFQLKVGEKLEDAFRNRVSMASNANEVRAGFTGVLKLLRLQTDLEKHGFSNRPLFFCSKTEEEEKDTKAKTVKDAEVDGSSLLVPELSVEAIPITEQNNQTHENATSVSVEQNNINEDDNVKKKEEENAIVVETEEEEEEKDRVVESSLAAETTLNDSTSLSTDDHQKEKEKEGTRQASATTAAALNLPQTSRLETMFQSTLQRLVQLSPTQFAMQYQALLLAAPNLYRSPAAAASSSFSPSTSYSQKMLATDVLVFSNHDRKKDEKNKIANNGEEFTSSSSIPALVKQLVAKLFTEHNHPGIKIRSVTRCQEMCEAVKLIFAGERIAASTSSSSRFQQNAPPTAMKEKVVLCIERFVTNLLSTNPNSEPQSWSAPDVQILLELIILNRCLMPFQALAPIVHRFPLLSSSSTESTASTDSSSSANSSSSSSSSALDVCTFYFRVIRKEIVPPLSNEHKNVVRILISDCPLYLFPILISCLRRCALRDADVMTDLLKRAGKMLMWETEKKEEGKEQRSGETVVGELNTDETTSSGVPPSEEKEAADTERPRVVLQTSDTAIKSKFSQTADENPNKNDCGENNEKEEISVLHAKIRFQLLKTAMQFFSEKKGEIEEIHQFRVKRRIAEEEREEKGKEKKEMEKEEQAVKGDGTARVENDVSSSSTLSTTTTESLAEEAAQTLLRREPLILPEKYCKMVILLLTPQTILGFWSSLGKYLPQQGDDNGQAERRKEDRDKTNVIKESDDHSSGRSLYPLLLKQTKRCLPQLKQGQLLSLAILVPQRDSQALLEKYLDFEKLSVETIFAQLHAMPMALRVNFIDKCVYRMSFSEASRCLTTLLRKDVRITELSAKREEDGRQQKDAEQRKITSEHDVVDGNSAASSSSSSKNTNDVEDAQHKKEHDLLLQLQASLFEKVLYRLKETSHTANPADRNILLLISERIVDSLPEISLQLKSILLNVDGIVDAVTIQSFLSSCPTAQVRRAVLPSVHQRVQDLIKKSTSVMEVSDMIITLFRAHALNTAVLETAVHTLFAENHNLILMKEKVEEELHQKAREQQMRKENPMTDLSNVNDDVSVGDVSVTFQNNGNEGGEIVEEEAVDDSKNLKTTTTTTSAVPAKKAPSYSASAEMLSELIHVFQAWVEMDRFTEGMLRTIAKYFAAAGGKQHPVISLPNLLLVADVFASEGLSGYEDIITRLLVLVPEMNSSEFARFLRNISKHKYWTDEAMEHCRNQLRKPALSLSDPRSLAIALKAIVSERSLLEEFFPSFQEKILESLAFMSAEDVALVMQTLTECSAELTPNLELLVDRLSTRLLQNEQLESLRRVGLMRVLQCLSHFHIQDEMFVVKAMKHLQSHTQYMDSFTMNNLLKAMVDLELCDEKLVLQVLKRIEDADTVVPPHLAVSILHSLMQLDVVYCPAVAKLLFRVQDMRDHVAMNPRLSALVKEIIPEYMPDVPPRLTATFMKSRRAQRRRR